ncbi:Piso0_000933 [Millerozyma farinosa CBS 7064]|uniref:Piso0_000933 protein n=1 Tax=Pichia sorbitophila (strain ATCC MYA-4447 / BCRC 22081 / CBS 7064 / NBRC 10061 / NRRL Y-12695) TaxID=559304 RepID=G8YQG4_PICSO|nr:Piso0_000933 [Millerozyma farinosa CBS 7064]
MFGIFDIFNLLIGIVYPILSSYKSLKDYNDISKRIDSGKLTFGSVQVPINEILKRATGEQEGSDGSKDEGKALQYAIVGIQKWLIYWLVFASINVTETILLVKHLLPFYSFSTFIFRMWLISPFFISGYTTDLQGAISVAEKELNEFSQRGCGLIFFSFLKPWLDGEVSMLEDLNLNEKFSYLFSSSILSQVASMSVKDATGPSSGIKDDSSYLSTFVTRIKDAGTSSGITKYFYEFQGGDGRKDLGDQSLPKSHTSTESTLTDDISDEYDLVDKPANASVKTAPNTAGFSSSVEAKSTEKQKGWFW